METATEYITQAVLRCLTVSVVVALYWQLVLTGSDTLLSTQASAMSVGDDQHEYITSDGRTVTSRSEVPAALLERMSERGEGVQDQQQTRRAGDEDLWTLDEIGGWAGQACHAMQQYRLCHGHNLLAALCKGPPD
jgi:hypothetical protein